MRRSLSAPRHPARSVPLALVLALALGACVGRTSPPTGSPTATGGGTPTSGRTVTPSPSPSPTGAASATPSPSPTLGGELVVMAHDSFAVSEETLAAFRAETGISVRILKAGDTGAALNQAILTRDRPLADVFFGVDDTFLGRALAADLFLPYAPEALGRVPDRFELDPRRRVSPVDYGDVCVNLDRSAFGEATGVPAPRTLRELADARYKGMLVVQNPATSSPGLAFLLATIAYFGEEGDYTWRDFWRDLRANDVLVTSGWEEAYYDAFSGGSGRGERPMVVSYASSPPVEVLFADPQPDVAPTEALLDGCYRQVEFAGILEGTTREPQARRFIDLLLSRRFQEELPLQMYVFPVDPTAALPEVFRKHVRSPGRTWQVDPGRIERERQDWIEEWDRIVLR